MAIFIFVIGVIFHLSYGSDEHMEPVYSPEHGNATFSFSVSPFNTGIYVFVREYENYTSVTLVKMYPSEIEILTNSLTFVGDISTGNISLLYTNVNKSEAGVYRLISFGVTGDLSPQCVSLVILGIPDVPTVVINRILDEGEDVVLTCSGSRSTTVPAGHNLPKVYFWIVDDVTNPDIPRYTYTANGVQLTTTNVQSTDTKKSITCRAKEDVTGGLSSANSSVVSVQIYYGPDNIIFDPSQDEYEEVEHTTLRPINCTASCYPACTYKWEKIGQSGQIGTNGILNLGYLQPSMTGTYKCIATNPERDTGSVGTTTKTLTLNVIYGPDNITFDPKQDEYTGVENTSLRSISCTASCYPNCTYTWEKTGKTGQIGASNVLNLGYLNCSMAGIYRCTAANPERAGSGSMTTRNVSLRAIYGPDKAVINDGQHINVTEGTHHADITCSSDCYPSCTSSWTSITGESAVVSSDVLSLGQVTRNQTGQYKCTTSNTALKYSHIADATIDITVHYAPDVTATVLPRTVFVENNSTELKCNANGVPSYYNYIALTQTIGSKTIPNRRPPIATMPLHSSLRFDALRLEDTGTYTCVVKNGVRDVAGILNQTSTIEIRVQVSPKILAEELTFMGAISEDVRISIPFYSFPPADSVSFTRQDGVQIQNNNRTTVSYKIWSVMTKFYGEDVILNGSIAYLQITNTQETDFTSYIVEVTNRIGRHMTVINLRTKGEPATTTSPNIGPIIGGVVGSVIVLGVGVVVGIFFRRWNSKLSSEKSSSHENHRIAREGPYTSMQYSADTGSEYLEINREHGQTQTGDKNVYVNLQLNVQ